MKNFLQSVTCVTAGVIVGFLIVTQFAFQKVENRPNENSNSSRSKWHAPQTPSSMDFAGEAVPLDSWDVRERFDRELLFNFYNQANVLFILKLAHRYFPVIEQRLKANGVPDDLQ